MILPDTPTERDLSKRQFSPLLAREACLAPHLSPSGAGEQLADSDDDVLSGWVRIHRKLLDDPWYRSLCLSHRLCWLTLILLANWKPGEHKCPRCGKRIKVARGELCMSRKTIADYIGVEVKVLDRAAVRAQKNGSLATLSRGRCHSHYRIVNYDEYQTDKDDSGDFADKARQSRGETATTIEEEKKEEEKKQSAAATKPKRSRPSQPKLPSVKPYTQADVAAAAEFGKMVGRNGRPSFAWATTIAKECPEAADKAQLLSDTRALLDAGFEIATPQEAMTKRVKLAQRARRELPSRGRGPREEKPATTFAEPIE